MQDTFTYPDTKINSLVLVKTASDYYALWEHKAIKFIKLLPQHTEVLELSALVQGDTKENYLVKALESTSASAQFLLESRNHCLLAQFEDESTPISIIHTFKKNEFNSHYALTNLHAKSATVSQISRSENSIFTESVLIESGIAKAITKSQVNFNFQNTGDIIWVSEKFMMMI